MKILVYIPLVIMLVGCPGGPRAPETKPTLINGDSLCFSINNKDELNYYNITTTNNDDIIFLDSSGNVKLHLFYPDSCINIQWKYGHSYVISYGLNGKNFVHEFFIDNNGQLTNLGDYISTTERGVFIHDDVICFSVNKSDTLNYYRVESAESGQYKIIKSGENLNLTYPNSCIKLNLKTGYRYIFTYILNGNKHSHLHFTDNKEDL
ncbi:putative T6SS immunity periplasmic lipoprotein [Scandinavium goeteborgense]|uniref:Uncharacterized protein n=1 Tax=Scandinavium goeteborgense TaxID=1851514 RepID=A0A4R6EMN9_SCAGO|nr:putative T6SS immunity periplasmic lipoprotein [Scandinavium goeteborgense]TDN60451.1 hypothetical protein EC847_10223 [Scandinavium goeteborgense]